MTSVSGAAARFTIPEFGGPLEIERCPSTDTQGYGAVF
jgi:hypothetical protein